MARSRVAGLLLLLVWLAGLAIGILWAAGDAGGWRLFAMATALAASGALAATAWVRSPRGTLEWDGGHWTWSSAHAPGQLSVRLDLQRALLVRWSSLDESRWFWLDAAASGQRWADLRRAVYSRATTDPSRQDRSTAANP